MKNAFSIIVLVLALVPGQVFGERVLTDIKMIRNLAPERAEKGIPVELDAQVMWTDARGVGFFVNDGEKGIYVRRERPVADPWVLKPGDRVRVEGKTELGGFSIAVVALKVLKTGHEPLREGAPYNMGFQSSSRIDCDWMRIGGRVISVTQQKARHLIVVGLLWNSFVLDVQLPYRLETQEKLKRLLFEYVNLDAVVGTVFNDQRQLVGRVFYAPSEDTFIVASRRYESKQRTKTKPIHELMREGMHYSWATRTEGTITYVGSREIYLKDPQSCLRAEVLSTSGLRAGDEVQVDGLVSVEAVSPSFRVKNLKVVRHGAPPEPVPFVWTNEVDSKRNFDWVYVDAKLVDIGRSFSMDAAGDNLLKQIVLLCESNGMLFEARLPVGEELQEHWKAGAVLRLTGICHLLRNDKIRWRMLIDGFQLELGGADRIRLLVPAPWWNAARLFWLLALVFGAMILFLIWVLLLRKTVQHQTRIIGEKIEQEAVLNERQRIARELHDNLEQGVAGAVFQLSGCRRLLELGVDRCQRLIRQVAGEHEPKARQASLKRLETQLVQESGKNQDAMAVVENILQHCSEESRTSILDLRGGLLEKMNLVSAVRVTLDQIKEERGGIFSVRVTGEEKRFLRAAERNILLVIREAALNAVQHGAPKKIDVVLDFTEGIQVSISDDGCGFREGEHKKHGHFGLQGMKERMGLIGGTLTVESHIGKGTVVTARVNVAGKQEMDDE